MCFTCCKGRGPAHEAGDVREIRGAAVGLQGRNPAAGAFELSEGSTSPVMNNEVFNITLLWWEMIISRLMERHPIRIVMQGRGRGAGGANEINALPMAESRLEALGWKTVPEPAGTPAPRTLRKIREGPRAEAAAPHSRSPQVRVFPITLGRCHRNKSLTCGRCHHPLKRNASIPSNPAFISCQSYLKQFHKRVHAWLPIKSAYCVNLSPFGK